MNKIGNIKAGGSVKIVIHKPSDSKDKKPTDQSGSMKRRSDKIKLIMDKGV